MGFFVNIIQDSRRSLTTDAQAPAVMNMPIFPPAADALVSEVVPPADFSHTVEGTHLRVQPEILQQANDASPDVTQPNAVDPPQSIARPREQPTSAVPAKKTSAFKATNRPTQPLEKEQPSPVSPVSSVPAHMAMKIPPAKKETTPVEPSGESEAARATTKLRKAREEVIDAPSNTEHTPVQVTTDVTDVQDVLHTPSPLLGDAEHMPVRDSEMIDVAQHVSAVEATNVRHVSMAIPLSAMPARSTRAMADRQHAEQSAEVHVPRVQIGKVNIVVERPGDSKRQPVTIPAGNDLASRTFLRSL